jgi:hypothetical protein
LIEELLDRKERILEVVRKAYLPEHFLGSNRIEILHFLFYVKLNQLNLQGKNNISA